MSVIAVLTMSTFTRVKSIFDHARDTRLHYLRNGGLVFVGGVILLILGSIPNSADPMVVWFFSFSVLVFQKERIMNGCGAEGYRRQDPGG